MFILVRLRGGGKVATASPRRFFTHLQSVRPCGAQAGRMLVLKRDNQLLSSCHRKVEPPLPTDGWTSSTCCLSVKKSRAALWRVAEKRDVFSFFSEEGRIRYHEVYQCVRYWFMFWIAEGRGTELVLEEITSSLWRCGLRWYLSLSLGFEEGDHGRTGEGGAPAAPSVPVPRPVARGLAERRQVWMQLLVAFTHGAPNPLRISTTSEHYITVSRKYSFLLHRHQITLISTDQVHECLGEFYGQLCSSV